MESSKIMMFPEVGNNSSIDPALLMALNNNGGFGGGNWIWILFLWLIAGGGMWGNNGFGNGFNGGAGFLSNQMNNNTGRELLMNAIQGNRESINALSSMLNVENQTIQNGIFALNNAINAVGTQVGMSGLQIQNAIQSGDAAIGRQLCECCCENRLLTSQSGYQSQIRTLEQTNQLGSQADRNTNSILDAIASQNTLITKEFCDLKERELQNTINAQGNIITQLRDQITTDHQTIQFNNAFRALDDKIDAIASKQPNTVPVQWPNLTAVNTTPYVNGGFYGNGFGWGNGFYGNGFGNNVIF